MRLHLIREAPQILGGVVKALLGLALEAQSDESHMLLQLVHILLLERHLSRLRLPNGWPRIVKVTHHL